MFLQEMHSQRLIVSLTDLVVLFELEHFVQVRSERANERTYVHVGVLGDLSVSLRAHCL